MPPPSATGELECRIPRASIRAAETAAERVGVAERGVDHRGVRDAEHELLEPDARQLLTLSEQAIVRRGIEIDDRAQVLHIVGNGGEHAIALR